MNSNLFDKLSLVVLFFVLVLLPVFFLPFTNIPLETSKGLLLVLGISLSVVFWALARFFDRQLSFPKSKVLLAGIGVVFFTLLSAFFSSNYAVSFFGIMFDLGSFWFIFSGFVLFLMFSIYFNTKERSRIVLFGMVLSMAVLFLFQIAYLFFPNIFSLGILEGKTGNIIGSWNVLGILAGFASFLSISIIEFFPLRRARKIFLSVLLLISLFFISLTNFSLVWCVLGILSLIVFVYKISVNFHTEDGMEKSDFPIFSFLVVLISLFFFVSNQFIGNFIPNRLGLSFTEINPSVKSTILVAKGVLSEDPLFGIGPNRFGEAWNMHRPKSINDTQFWDISFGTSFGLLPTFLVTNGLFSILSWVVFLSIFIFSGVKFIFSFSKNRLNWETLVFFLASVYLFIFAIFYPVGLVAFLVFLAFSGVFVGLISSLCGEELLLSFREKNKKGFVLISMLIILIIFSSTMTFKYVEKFASVVYFRQALVASSLEEAESLLLKALSLNTNDLYLRTLAQLSLMKLNVASSASGSLTEEDKTKMQLSLNQALESAQMAVSYNRENYLNFQMLGGVYSNAVVLGTKDAYTEAVAAYESASQLNPMNPGLKLAIASSFLAGGKDVEAKEYASQSLSLKPDYVEALIFMSQIYKQEGNKKEAIEYAQKALLLLPGNKEIIDYINSLSSVPSPAVSTEKTKQ